LIRMMDDLTQVEIKDKYYDLLKHNKAELDKTVSQCLEVIDQDDDILRNNVKKKNLTYPMLDTVCERLEDMNRGYLLCKIYKP
jgi:hypothetical protein